MIRLEIDLYFCQFSHFFQIVDRWELQMIFFRQICEQQMCNQTNSLQHFGLIDETLKESQLFSLKLTFTQRIMIHVIKNTF